MGLFSRKPKQPATIPEPYLRGLRDFGEHLAGRRAGFNSSLVADLELMDFAHDRPEAFVDMLASGIAQGPSHITDYAGPASLGAVETIVHVYSLQVSSPAWYQLMDAAIGYLRANRIPYQKLKPYMRARWEQSHLANQW